MFKIPEADTRDVTAEEVLSALRITKKRIGTNMLSDKAKKVKDLLSIVAGSNAAWYSLFSAIIEEEISAPITNLFGLFERLTPIIPLRCTNGHDYPIGMIALFYKDNTFYKSDGKLGNSMDQQSASWRFPEEYEVIKML